MKCPICDSLKSSVFFDLKKMPISVGALMKSRADAMSCPKGNIQLAFCESCGFIWNTRFDPKKLSYRFEYDNSLDYSHVFQEYAESLASRLIESHQLNNKKILEIGCGNGRFLAQLCAKGDNQGIGFDPSFDVAETEAYRSLGVEFVRDFYNENYKDLNGDFVCTRHVLEHVSEPISFLKTIKQAMNGGEDARGYIEVPNTRFILESESVWDVIYEHCNYFTHESLFSACQRNGLRVLRIGDSYMGQFLSVDISRNGDDILEPSFDGDLKNLTKLVNQFSKRAEARLAKWHSRLKEICDKGERVVAWGAGAKAVGFFNMLEAHDELPFVVDLNPHKQGHFIPGTGQKIVSPEFLSNYKPDTLVVMNPAYELEIESRLDEMNLYPVLELV